MIERKYEVSVGNDIIAFGMTLDDALLFIRAYFEKYAEERDMLMAVKEMKRATGYESK